MSKLCVIGAHRLEHPEVTFLRKSQLSHGITDRDHIVGYINRLFNATPSFVIYFLNYIKNECACTYVILVGVKANTDTNMVHPYASPVQW